MGGYHTAQGRGSDSLGLAEWHARYLNECNFLTAFSDQCYSESTQNRKLLTSRNNWLGGDRNIESGGVTTLLEDTHPLLLFERIDRASMNEVLG